jgi:flagellar biogenesis protein FliO
MSAADDLAVLARVTVALVVVVALAVLAARLARRAGVRGQGIGLRVVERAGLSREASLAVVEVAGRGLVLGVTAHGVTLLTELEPGQLDAATTAAATGTEATAGTAAASGGAGAVRRVVVHAPAAHGARPRGTGSVLDPRTWRQTVEALRDVTARRR